MNLNKFLKRNGRPYGIQKANHLGMRWEIWLLTVLASTFNYSAASPKRETLRRLMIKRSLLKGGIRFALNVEGRVSRASRRTVHD